MDAFSKLPELAALIGSAPWVQCAEYADAGAVSCVGINDVDASQHAVSQLADGGRKRIAMINHDLSYKYARLRERGYKSVIHLRDLDYQAVEYASELSSGAGMAAMQNLLKANPPDAVFAVSDTLAAGRCAPFSRQGCGCQKISRWSALTAPSWRRWFLSPPLNNRRGISGARQSICC